MALSPTRLDRFLMALSPAWGLERMRARAAAQILTTGKRHYEAASSGRRTSGWARNYGDADIAIGRALVELRMHARDLVRNNAWARRAQSVITHNTVGWGIVPKAITPDVKAAQAAQGLWRRWAGSTECSSEGRHTFYGVQSLVMRSIVESGEVLVRRRFRRPTDNLTIPLQLQVLESDYLDHARLALSSQAGGPIIRGVEYDKLGRRAAYWIFPEHPGSGRNVKMSVRIDASEIVHVFREERPGQTRGVSWLAAAIVAMKDLDEYDDAELMKQKIAALFGAFVTDDGPGTALGEQSTDDPLVETFEPGMIVQLPPGKQVTFPTPPTMTADSLPTRTLRRIAAACDVTYEDLSGDYSSANFSSARMARLAHWASVRDWQHNMLIPILCQPIWGWAMEAAQVAGELPPGDLPASEWTPPPMPMLEPDKEGLAYSRLVRNGVMTYSEMVREQGGDPDTHWLEYAEDQKRLDSLGIKLDSDVRAVSAAGLTQERFGSGGGSTGGSAPTPPAPVDASASLDPEIDITVEEIGS